MIIHRIKPSNGDYILFVFALLNIIANLHSFWNGEIFWSHNSNYFDPFATYNHNIGIQIITGLAFLLNIVIVGLILSWRYYHKYANRVLLALLFLCVFGSILTWTELWYGSTFYYGEVRDKQGLPFGVNNGGLTGSFAFLFYTTSRIKITPYSEVNRKTYLILCGVVLLFIHYLLWRLVYEPWNLFQS